MLSRTGTDTVRAAIYGRASTAAQENANQILRLTQWADQRGFTVVGVYEEQESAWKAGHQRVLSELLRDAQRGRFQIVLVWALDRLSREGAMATLSLVHRLNSCGVRVLSFQESWTEAPGELTELLLALTGWVARMESQRQRERTKAGLTRVRAHGQQLGRPKGSKDTRKRRRRQSYPAIQPFRFDENADAADPL